MIRKAFAYVVRSNMAGSAQLLVLTDHHGRMSVPKGTVDEGESHDAAAIRELYEESGIEHGEIHRSLGERTVWIHGGPEMEGPLEEQGHAGFLIRTSSELPERWSHTIRCSGINNGYVYRYEWRELTEELCETLAYGADWFARELLSTLS